MVRCFPTHLPTGFSDFSHGSSTGDYDSDGDVDVWVNNLGAHHMTTIWPKFPYLLENDGAGHFEVVADFSAYTPEPYIGPNGIFPDENIFNGGWSASVDAEGDGDIDLVLGNDAPLFSEGPTEYYNMLLVNDGSGVFTRLPSDAWPKTVCAAFPYGAPDPEGCRHSQGTQGQRKTNP